MKFDAMDKYNLRNERKERSMILLLILLIFIFLTAFIFIVYLNSIKLSQINLIISGLSDDFKDDFKNIISSRNLLQVFLPNFKKKIKELYYIDDIKFSFISLKRLNILITEKKPYCVIYDRNRGIFYQVNDNFIVLRKVMGSSILSSCIISFEVEKVFNKGEKIDLNSGKIDLYNEDNQLSEIIIDKANIFGIPIKYKFIVSFGSFIDKTKLNNIKLLFSFIENKSEDARFNKIRYIDLTYSDIARIILE
ncbi:MAG: hypothetical protein WH035_03920 [Spirochaetota bacterium]